MHELGIAERVKDVVIEAAAAHRGKRVETVMLKVGRLRAIEPDTMTLCWQAVTQDTEISGALLDVEEVPAAGRCRQCDHAFEVEELVFVCPECGGVDVETVKGKELQVDRIRLS